jgi:hypothetical protein
VVQILVKKQQVLLGIIYFQKILNLAQIARVPIIMTSKPPGKQKGGKASELQ